MPAPRLSQRQLDALRGGGRAPTEAEAVRLILPWPPTVNTYWRHVGAKVLISRKGRAYRQNVEAAVLAQGRPSITGRLHVRVLARCPDRRERDMDNILKATLDALAHAGVYANDSQVDHLEVERRKPKPGGELLVLIERMCGRGKA